MRLDISKTLNIVRKYEEYGYRIHRRILVFSIICVKNLGSKFFGGSKHQQHPNRDKILVGQNTPPQQKSGQIDLILAILAKFFQKFKSGIQKSKLIFLSILIILKLSEFDFEHSNCFQNQKALELLTVKVQVKSTPLNPNRGSIAIGLNN